MCKKRKLRASPKKTTFYNASGQDEEGLSSGFTHEENMALQKQLLDENEEQPSVIKKEPKDFLMEKLKQRQQENSRAIKFVLFVDIF